MNRYEQAVDGIEVTAAGDVVRVSDGHTTWLCDETAWDAAVENLSARDAIDGDEGGALAYSELCSATARRSAIASVDSGSCHGARAAQADLIAKAFSAGLVDSEMAERMAPFPYQAVTTGEEPPAGLAEREPLDAGVQVQIREYRAETGLYLAVVDGRRLWLHRCEFESSAS